MQKGTTSRAMAAERPSTEFYDFYSVSLEYFGYHNITAVDHAQLPDNNNLNTDLVLSFCHQN
jgi:hypothetical protein